MVGSAGGVDRSRPQLTRCRTPLASSRWRDESDGLAGQFLNEIDRATLRRVRASSSPGGEFQKGSVLMMTG